MRRAAALVLALLVAGCGGSGGGSGTAVRGFRAPATALGATRALGTWLTVGRRGDGPATCRLMTPRGVAAYRTASFSGPETSCASHPMPVHRPLPPIGPTGTKGSTAVVSVREPQGLLIAYTLRYRAGRWFLDYRPTLAPVATWAHVRGVPRRSRLPLPRGGRDQVAAAGAAGRFVDGGVAKGTMPRLHVGDVAVIGDLALAYLLPGSDVAGQAPPPPKHGPLPVVILARAHGSWRVAGSTFAAFHLPARS